MPDWRWMAVVSVLALPLPMTGQQPEAVKVPVATGFLYKTVTIDDETYAYCVYVPPQYSPDKPWPVILFLHGSGAYGSDGLRQTDNGIGRAIRRRRDRIPAIVVMPQCRPKMTWVGPMGKLALRCVERTSREYHLDPQRVYLTGQSLGGHGVWHMAARFPGRFAAIVPVCGFAELDQSTGLAAKLAPHLKDVPIWCFHGALDTNVPVAKAREMIAAIREVGGKPFYTEYPDGRHAIWDRVYNDPELWKWLFAQPSGVSEGGTSKTRVEKR